MLEAKAIGYRHEDGPWLFQQLSLEIAPGEIVGLYGKSGSGKTTLARIMADYLKPEAGIVKVDQQDGQFAGTYPVQLVWQHPEKAINPRWRMKKVLAEAGDIDQGVLDVLGIRPSWLTRYPSELSGGELQRFCLARALGPNTKYLIADEMTTMLDAITQAQIWHIILEMVKERDIGVLAISHDEDLLKKVCDRVIDFNSLQ